MEEGFSGPKASTNASVGSHAIVGSSPQAPPSSSRSRTAYQASISPGGDGSVPLPPLTNGVSVTPEGAGKGPRRPDSPVRQRSFRTEWGQGGAGVRANGDVHGGYAHGAVDAGMTPDLMVQEEEFIGGGNPKRSSRGWGGATGGTQHAKKWSEVGIGLREWSERTGGKARGMVGDRWAERLSSGWTASRERFAGCVSFPLLSGSCTR